jgi:hypothetical protein
MKIIKSISLSLFIVAGSIAGASGDQFRTNTNPALLYYQAFLEAPDLPQADRDYLFTNQWRGQKLPDRFGELMSRYDTEFKSVRQAAHSTVPCDWGLDMSQGPATLLPHLPRAKAAAQAAQLRVIWDLQHGRQADARDDLLATFVLGRNTSRDNTLIGALVQFAMECLVYGRVAENFGQFSPETLKQLVDGFDAAPARGTTVTCIQTERAIHVDWLSRNIQELQKANGSDDAKTMTAIHELFVNKLDYDTDKTNFWEQVTKAAGGTSEGVVKLVRDLEPLYQRLAKTVALPQPEFENQAKQLDEDMEKSQNPLVHKLLFSPIGSRVKESRTQAWQAMVRAAVEYKLHGESGLKSVKDPFGNGPFAFRRFEFDGVDRGFELTSAWTGFGYPCALIFVEKEGPPFRIQGQNIGQAVQP